VPSRLINLTLPNSRFVDRLKAEAERKTGRTVSPSEVVNIVLDYCREPMEREDARVDLKTLLPKEP